MSDLQTIETVLDRAAGRRRLSRAWSGLWKGLLTGTVLWLVALICYKVLPISVMVLPAAGIASLVCAVIGFCIGWFRRMTRVETARWLDQENKLKERLSTALEVSSNPKAAEWQNLLIVDAANHAREVDPRKLLPLSLPLASRWALIVLLVTAGLGFVPEYRSKEYVQKQQDAEHIKETARKLAELIKRNLQTHPPIQPATEKAMETVQDVAEKLQTRAMTKPDAIKELASVSDKLKEQVQDLSKNPALKRMEKAARQAGGETPASPAGLQKKIDDLQKALGDQADSKKMDKFKSDLEKLQQAAAGMANNGSNAESREQMSQALSNLSKKAEAMGLQLPQINEAIEALMGSRIDQVMKDLNMAMADLDKMKELARQMQALKGQMEKMGKDLAEQLDKGQAEAAKSTLEKMAEALQKSTLPQGQLEKMMSEVSKSIDPAKDYGKVQELLKQGLHQMRQGQKGEASKSLADAAKELQKQMGEGQDLESLMAALDQLKGAQLCIGDGECLFGYCRSKYPSSKAGKGRGGQGVGDWAENDQRSPEELDEFWDSTGMSREDMFSRGHTDRDPSKPDNLTSTKIKGQMSPGGQMPSITLKGVHIKGEARVKYEEAVAAAQSDAQSALSQEKVPRAYQGAVKEYFNDFKDAKK